MKELMLLRHAKSSWKDLSLRDFDRPLKGRGKRNALTMAHYLQQEGLVPDIIICSPALRTRQTLQRLMSICDWPQAKLVYEQAVYEAPGSTLRQVLQQVSGRFDRCLLVGHNPGLEELLSTLVADCPSFPMNKTLPTGSLAHICLNGKHGPHRLRRLVQPRALDPKSLAVIDPERIFIDLAS